MTVSLGRELYLKQLINSIDKLTNWQEHNFLHYLIYQGEPSTDFLLYINSIPYQKQLIINRDVKKSIGKVMEEFKGICSSDIFWKLDDDALLYTPNSFDHIEELYKIHSNAVFSPYPVGFIERPGGASSIGHTVMYSKRLDKYYTLRKVNNIAGFARIMPVNILKQISFADRHDDDADCAIWCRRNNVPMFILENCLVVEHNETKYGQYLRYGETYLRNKLS